MRRLVLVMLLLIVPVALLAQHDAPPATGHEAAAEGHGGGEEPGGGEHAAKTYFGIPGWILKTVNVILFFGALAYWVGGPLKRAFADRSAAIRQAAQEARERREKADRMAGEIQARLAAIEQEVQAIHERARTEGERQKQELIAAAEAEAEKILTTARNEVETRVKRARTELTEYAGELAAERAEALLRERITKDDQRKLFEDSVRAVSEVQS